jgi:hypothetical protein
LTSLQTLQSFLTSKCSPCKVKTVAAEFEKRKANNLFFWVGGYPTNLTYDNGKKSIKIYITNAAKSINGKVTDRSVFINGNFKNKVVLLKTSSTNISEAFRTSGFSLGVTLESGVKTRGFEELD